MADNTTLNLGSGGDVIRTEDVGGGVKVPVSKIHIGASDVDGGPFTITNPFPVLSIDGTGQVLSGSTVQTVQYLSGDFGTSGSANQLIAPQGATNRIRVLSAHVMAPAPVMVRWLSTGSAGTITNISGLMPISVTEGFILPYNPHGWFQTRVNEGLNVSLTAGVSCGIVLTWALAGA